MLVLRSTRSTLSASLYRTVASAQRPCLTRLASCVTSRFQSSGAAAISPVSSTLQKEYYAEHRNAYHAKNFKKMWKAAGKTKQVGNAAAKQWISEMREIDQKLDAFIRVLATNSRTSERTKRLLGSKTCHVQTYSIEAPRSVPPHIEIDDGILIVDGKKIPNIWLRDNCQCSSCMHESTKQRLLDTFAISKDVHIVGHDFVKDEKAKDLTIEWSDGHQSTYLRAFLTRQTADLKPLIRQAMTKPTLWDASIAPSPPSVSHDMPDLSTLLTNLRTHGFCYVDGVAHPDPSATEALLKRISFIRETHYGGFYDFTADLASQDTAYTNIALEAHTDTTYFSDPAGLQAFHLLSHTDGEGGASLLVDGFKVAQELYETDREAYNVLSSVNVHGHASGNEGISIQPYRGFPVLEHDPATNILLRVRWNSSDRASIDLPIDEVETWYDAARKFDALLKKKENEYWQQLTPGRVLIFDNWRVLHGRSAFTGTRRICGGYINRDDWISKYKMEVYGKDEVFKSLASG